MCFVLLKKNVAMALPFLPSCCWFIFSREDAMAPSPLMSIQSSPIKLVLVLTISTTILLYFLTRDKIHCKTLWGYKLFCDNWKLLDINKDWPVLFFRNFVLVNFLKCARFVYRDSFSHYQECVMVVFVVVAFNY